MSVLAVIPARGQSKGLPGKNIKPFNGLPLIAHSINVALASKLTDRVIITTDDEEIASISRSYGAEVPYMRPEEIAGDKSTDQEYLRHAIDWFNDHGESYETIVLLRPTCVFRTSEEIDKGINELLSSDFDCIRGISEVSYSPYWMKKKDGNRLISFINSEYQYSLRQSLPEVVQANGAVDVLRSSVIMEHENIYGENIGFLDMDEVSRTDIDTNLDFMIAEFLHQHYQS
jgi:N-acylneuraminate cytidylyltransferase/CMP-N,N'-diacetyllegionaminic acid synthase|tara:strand:- start:2692 stop:3381 length:690 start_codon:yes stop_codon:yes gene_type:complete